MAALLALLRQDSDLAGAAAPNWPQADLLDAFADFLDSNGWGSVAPVAKGSHRQTRAFYARLARHALVALDAPCDGRKTRAHRRRWAWADRSRDNVIDFADARDRLAGRLACAGGPR
jgi:hypothetical protein